MRIAVIEGHPDSDEHRFGHALAEAYSRGATAAGHEVRRIAVGRLEFPVLRSKADWDQRPAPTGVQGARDDLLQSDHLVLLFPLWLGTTPALLQAFLEQVLRPSASHVQPARRRRLAGKSARLVVTMGMPGFVYRWMFGAHGVRNLAKSILAFSGVRPVRATYIGRIEAIGPAVRQRWLRRMEELGRSGR